MMNKPKDEQALGRIDFGMTTVVCITVRIECYSWFNPFPHNDTF